MHGSTGWPSDRHLHTPESPTDAQNLLEEARTAARRWPRAWARPPSLHQLPPPPHRSLAAVPSHGRRRACLSSRYIRDVRSRRHRSVSSPARSGLERQASVSASHRDDAEGAVGHAAGHEGAVRPRLRVVGVRVGIPTQSIMENSASDMHSTCAFWMYSSQTSVVTRRLAPGMKLHLPFVRQRVITSWAPSLSLLLLSKTMAAQHRGLRDQGGLPLFVFGATLRL